MLLAKDTTNGIGCDNMSAIFITLKWCMYTIMTNNWNFMTIYGNKVDKINKDEILIASSNQICLIYPLR